MNPIRLAVERPHTVAVASILVALFSWLAFREIPVQIKPTLDVPRVDVTTRYRGASAVEVEEQVTRELEAVVPRVDGLVELTSPSSEGMSQSRACRRRRTSPSRRSRARPTGRW